jgi:hypothetical protein
MVVYIAIEVWSETDDTIEVQRSNAVSNNGCLIVGHRTKANRLNARLFS